MTEFKDIRIIDMAWHAATKVNWDSPAFDIHFKVSASAPEHWSEIFEVEWENSKSWSFPQLNARASSTTIIMNAPPQDIDLDEFVAHLKDTINRTNERYREHLLHEAQKKSEEQAKAQLEERRLFDLKRRLKLNNDQVQ